ncbi:hypothetical protein KY284_012683 [Solanum tuberosum]|nr:hypothetical protein KY284_012683 [Solanum tuberosum]
MDLPNKTKAKSNRTFKVLGVVCQPWTLPWTCVLSFFKLRHVYKGLHGQWPCPPSVDPTCTREQCLMHKGSPHVRRSTCSEVFHAPWTLTWTDLLPKLAKAKSNRDLYG